MLRRFDHHGVAWLDLESPTTDEIESIATEFTIPADLLYELVTPTEKPRVTIYPNLVYAVFHFPAIRGEDGGQSEEIDVILGKDFLITVHYRPLDAVDDFAKAFEVVELLGRNTNVSSGYLLLELTTRLYRASESQLDALEGTINIIERQIFMGLERQMVTSISRVGRELLLVKRVLGNHTETLEALENASISLFGDSMRNYFHGVAALHYRAYARAVSIADIVTELRETNLALLSTRQNEIMKNLTVITAVMLPLSLLANIFSMNTDILPIVGQPNDFWVILCIMGILTSSFILYFKLKRWF